MAKKLELTWFEKEKRLMIEPRLLIENPSLSFKKENDSLFDDGIYDNICSAYFDLQPL